MDTTSITVTIVNNDEQLMDAYEVRKEVFVYEQQVPMELEIDEFEAEATHFVLYKDQKPVGAGRLRFVDGYGKVERICVVKSERGTGAGKALMDKIEAFTKEKGINKLKLHAQTHAISFYSNLEYEIVSDEYVEAGIPHRTMTKSL